MQQGVHVTADQERQNVGIKILKKKKRYDDQ